MGSYPPGTYRRSEVDPCCCCCAPLCFHIWNLSEKEDLEFLLHKSIPGHEEIFEEVSDNNLQPGDIVLFSENYGSIAVNFKHAAVYCGDGEVIHFQVMNDRKNTGRISKEGYEPMKRKRGKCQVYRKKGGINLNEFHRRVREAMNSEVSYASDENSIHFAFYLVDVLHYYNTLVEIQKQGDGGQAWRCNIM